MDQNASPLVLDLDDERSRDVNLSGGKGASLARMRSYGLTVPPGFVITSTAFAESVDHEKLRTLAQKKDMLGVRELVQAAEPPRELIALFFGPHSTSRVAVRSSACAEDSEGASYAGQQETYLNVEGLDTVLEKVVECWLSFFSDRAVFYREAKGSLADVAMAVVVQQMVNARKAGVMFTVDPVSGRKDRIVIEAAFGLGEQVVSGEVTPDCYTLDRSGAIRKARVVDEQVMNEEELAELVHLGLKLVDFNDGQPQDIEWACDDSGMYLLQSRPVTTL